MKKSTFLMALLVSAIGIGQNLTQETMEPINGQSGARATTAQNVATSFTELTPNVAAPFNGFVYRNSNAENMMPVLAYESGPYFNIAGPPDISRLENTTLGMNILGAGVQTTALNRVADDIVLADDYDITSMDFFAYQTGAPTAPASISDIDLQIWDGVPGDPGSTVIFTYAGPVTSVWSNAYRESETTPGTNRAIQRITVSPVGLSLAAGTYWVDYSLTGDGAFSGPWQPPVAILGQANTGNGLRSISGAAWEPFLDGGGTEEPQGVPLQVYGDCTSCVGGGTVTFTTLMDLQDNCTGIDDFTMEDFEGSNVAPGGVLGCGPVLSSSGDASCFAPGILEENFNVTINPGAAPPLDTVIGDTGFAGAPHPVVGANTFVDFTIINFTGMDDVTSAGFNIFHFNSPTVEVRLFDAGGVQIETYTVPNTQTFFGFISSVPISRVELEGAGGTSDLIGNLVFGACILNDICTEAIAVTCGETVTGNTDGDTDSGGTAANDEFYSFTGTGTQQIITVSLCGPGTDYDSLIHIYSDCTLTNELAVDDDGCGIFAGASEVSFVSDGTSTYYIMVEGFDAPDSGNFEMTITCNDVVANDLCDNAVAVGCDSVTAGSTTFATIDTGVAQDCDNTGDGPPGSVTISSPGVWYTYTETIPGLISDITLSTCNDADFDTKISVYEGDCGALTCVAANDDGDGCAGFTSEVSFQSDGVSTYYILVHGFGGATGDFNLSVTCAPVPPPNDMIVNSIDVDEIGFPYTDPSVNMPAATTEAGGTPAECDNAGVLGVWYNFVPEMDGTATASVTSPAGYTSVTFYTAPDEDAVETDLTLVTYFDNQCVPGADASIPVTAGQAYYVYVANHGGVTDIVIDGSFYLGVGDAVIDGFTYFPNPANNELNLDAGTRSIDSAAIYNILGQAVLDLNVGATRTQLDVASLSVGTYIMKVVVEGEVGIYKIVKQ